MRPPAEEELRRVLPVVRELAAADAAVSVHTMLAEVAARALDAVRVTARWGAEAADTAPLPPQRLGV